MLNRFRARLADVDALPQLAILGLVSGLLAGGVIILFRLSIEHTQMAFLPGGGVENYEDLSALLRFMLPTLGGLLIGLIFHALSTMGGGGIQVGIVHVLERIAYHQSHLPLRNFTLQFVGAALSIISGHSVGREGPGVHLGAASGSLLGQGLHLPNNSIQTLVACGAAASIAASFNTPIAGVVFAMEVIVMEYTIAGFAPIILAAVSATALTRSVFGAEPAFEVPPLQMASLYELPYLLVMGLVVGALAAGFITSLQYITRVGNHVVLWQRLTLAGALTGLCALLVPEIMGVGYDTVNQAMLGQLGIGLLLMVVLFKTLATTLGLGLGLPGGLIGPTLVIGAAAGGILGHVADMLFPGQVASPGFYAMIGMSSMMGATLQAPLAALLALLELTANPNIILPGMLAVVASGITSSHLFNRESVFITLLKARGLDMRNNPVAQTLRRVGVLSVMNTSFLHAPRRISRIDAERLLDRQPLWIVVDEEDKPSELLLAADLALYLNTQEDIQEDTLEQAVDLLEIPAQRENIVYIPQQATLQEALDTMDEKAVDALCVSPVPGTHNIIGILTRQNIETYYRDGV
ncbi:MAG TPA: chloride channel protein [Gammaproteobacteria bacterium]|nr:chloride channel protein [Gammaproteobacteria bacterium]